VNTVMKLRVPLRRENFLTKSMELVLAKSRFDDPFYQRLAQSASKQHLTTVTCLPGTLSVLFLTILSAASLLECTVTATSLLLHASTFGVQVKSWQQRLHFPPKLGLDTLHAEGGGGVKDHELATLL
jgi:hypothetical protein